MWERDTHTDSEWKMKGIGLSREKYIRKTFEGTGQEEQEGNCWHAPGQGRMSGLLLVVDSPHSASRCSSKSHRVLKGIVKSPLWVTLFFEKICRLDLSALGLRCKPFIYILKCEYSMWTFSTLSVCLEQKTRLSCQCTEVCSLLVWQVTKQSCLKCLGCLLADSGVSVVLNMERTENNSQKNTRWVEVCHKMFYTSVQSGLKCWGHGVHSLSLEAALWKIFMGWTQHDAQTQKL